MTAALESCQSESIRETRSSAADLARRLQPGDVVLLIGPLGAGKTAFAAGIAKALGSRDPVSSPTFVFVHEYSARLPLAHADLYRLPGGADIDDLGIREYLGGRWVLMVEWPERAADFDWGCRVWRVTIEINGEKSRRIIIAAPGAEDGAP